MAWYSSELRWRMGAPWLTWPTTAERTRLTVANPPKVVQGLERVELRQLHGIPRTPACTQRSHTIVKHCRGHDRGV